MLCRKQRVIGRRGKVNQLKSFQPTAGNRKRHQIRRSVVLVVICFVYLSQTVSILLPLCFVSVKNMFLVLFFSLPCCIRYALLLARPRLVSQAGGIVLRVKIVYVTRRV